MSWRPWALCIASTLACQAEEPSDLGASEPASDASGAAASDDSSPATTTTADPGGTAASSGGGTTSTDAPPTDDGAAATTATDEPAPGCYDYAAFVAQPVGYRADVMPIFATWCSPCHADPNASIYFGTGGTSEAEAVAVRTKLLQGVPKQAPDLAFVAPGDPLHSYMLAKVEYPIPGATCSEIQCSEPGCELPAPPAGPLSEVDKAVLRSWIIQGAADD